MHENNKSTILIIYVKDFIIVGQNPQLLTPNNQ